MFAFARSQISASVASRYPFSANTSQALLIAGPACRDRVSFQFHQAPQTIKYTIQINILIALLL